MTEPTPTTVADAIDVLFETYDSDVDGDSIALATARALGIDPDMPLSQLREDLAVAARVRQCQNIGYVGGSDDAVSCPLDPYGVTSAVELLAWLREGSNQ